MKPEVGPYSFVCTIKVGLYENRMHIEPFSDPRVFGLKTTFTMPFTKAFPKNTILYNSRTNKLDNPGEYASSVFTNIDSVKSNMARGHYEECPLLLSLVSSQKSSWNHHFRQP